jgi:hypothetical protein
MPLRLFGFAALRLFNFVLSLGIHLFPHSGYWLEPLEIFGNERMRVLSPLGSMFALFLPKIKSAFHTPRQCLLL